MIVTRTDMGLQADQISLIRRESRETLRAWRGDPPTSAQNGESTNSLFSRAGMESLTRSPRAQTAPSLPSAPSAPSLSSSNDATVDAIHSASEAVENDPFIMLLRRMIEMMTGQEMNIFDVTTLSADVHHAEMSATSVTGEGGAANWGAIQEYHAVREEFEQTTFAANGVIHTADGREFEFEISLEMTRSYREETHATLLSGNAVRRKDPLVVNFDGTAARLAEEAGQRFRFDLDGDGTEEDLPLFASGSGYLSIDLNHNGKIDNGRELFGPATDSGFGELAGYDEDGNGWIDENDSVYDRLRIWRPSGEGEGSLMNLKEAEVGALALAHVASPFGLRGGDNRDLGLVRASGLYLTESGRAGSMQEIDLTV